MVVHNEFILLQIHCFVDGGRGDMTAVHIRDLTLCYSSINVQTLSQMKEEVM